MAKQNARSDIYKTARNVGMPVIMEKVRFSFSSPAYFHRTKGTILSTVTKRYRDKSLLEVEIKYTTDFGEDCILSLQTNVKYTHLFKISDNIPIYVNGEYANVNEEELEQDYVKRAKRN